MSRKTRFIDACYRRPVDCTPVWLMRQAGRYQASYQAIRQNMSFFELCSTPDVAAEVTVNAVEELGVDAGIIFSDILVPLRAMGAPVELTHSGPKLSDPIRDEAGVAALEVVDPLATMPFVMRAIEIFNDHFQGEVPLIGFAGGPITLAAYLTEGGHSKSYADLKRMLFAAPKTAHQLLDKLARQVVEHLKAQVEAGCHAVQVFDSWVGVLSPSDYAELALPYHQRIFDELRGLGVPRILFGTDTATLLPQMATVDAEVIGLDWRIDLDEGWRIVGERRAVQGNLDPCCLLMDQPALEKRVQQVVDAAAGRDGHIFNLGHGVLPPTPVENARFVVETVHRLTQR
ncbi:MAG: uroporphyrinogen decarboxylase [Myxococcales bacterium]|nr:uroporphyrinogen decarboxylase [Myxococcales bacterium]